MELPRATFNITPMTTDSQFQTFLNNFRPSVVRPDHHSWIQITRQSTHNSINEISDLEGAVSEWESTKGPRSKAQVDQLAQQYLVLEGKWLLFPSPATVDETWMAIAVALRSGALGHSAKVSPIGGTGARASSCLICVYTENYLDVADVRRVRESLRRLGYTKKLGYKPDIYTYLNIYKGNPWQISPVVYSE